MKTAIVANQKGGVGKTTVARHLVFYGLMKNLRVLAVDLDVQKNLTTTCHNIAIENGLPLRDNALMATGLFSTSNHTPLECSKNLWLVGADDGIVGIERSELDTIIRTGQARFKELSKHFDVCIIDTGPAVSNLLVVALAVGDFAVSPCKPDRDAIAGLAGFFSNVVRVRDETGINPRLASLGVLLNQVVQKRAYHRDVINDMRAHWKEGVLPVELYERAAIDMAKDRPVWMTDKGESRSLAAKEMKAVCACIYQRMGV